MIDKIKKSFDEYLNLNYVKSRNDPEEEPFKTKYEARKLIQSLLENLNANLENLGEYHESTEFIAPLSHANVTYVFFCNKISSLARLNFNMSAKSYLVSKFLQFNLAKNFIETEEVETGEKIIEKILEEFATFEEDNNIYNPLFFSLKLSCFNELIFVWSHRADYKKSLQLVMQIDLIYDIYKNESIKSFIPESYGPTTTMPFELNELIVLNKESDEEKRRKAFEALYTHSLFFFAQIYGKIDEKEKSAYYCRLTLQRQLDQYNDKLNEKEIESNRESSDYQNEKVIFNPLDWATHAGAISQYYICLEDFATARHCLCCSESVMETLNRGRVFFVIKKGLS
jgi:KIF-binding protein